ncbi:MAG: LysR family transcriptional regulator [Campylobacteraceae bacterium]|nr:LysR family transcriptional regulator [Campylobacteraceae bacterium]
MRAKVKVWIDDDSDNLIFGGGKTQILEYIDETGSIAEAAKKVGMNYKKAWTHIKILQEFLEDELVITSKGGKGQGGTVLTPKAKEIVATFKTLQNDIKIYTQQRYEELFIGEDDTILHSKVDNG